MAEIILRGESYATGQIVEHWGGETFELTFPLIISVSLYMRVRKRARKNQTFARRNTRHPALLQGIIRCAAHPTWRMFLKRGRRRPNSPANACPAPYRTAGKVSMEGCARRVPAASIDRVVWKNVSELWLSPLVLPEDIGPKTKGSKAQMGELRERIATLTRAIGKTRDERHYAISNAAALGLAVSEVTVQLAEIEERKASLTQEKRKAESELSPAEIHAEFPRLLEQSIKDRRKELKGRMSFNRKREIVQGLVDVLWIKTNPNWEKTYQAELAIVVPLGKESPHLRGSLNGQSNAESDDPSSGDTGRGSISAGTANPLTQRYSWRSPSGPGPL